MQALVSTAILLACTSSAVVAQSPYELSRYDAVQNGVASIVRLEGGQALESTVYDGTGSFRKPPGFVNTPTSCMADVMGNFLHPDISPYIVGVTEPFFDSQLSCGMCLNITNPKNVSGSIDPYTISREF